MIAPPKLLRTSERDVRGYPIPFIVQRDQAGKPHFPVADAKRVQEVLRKRLCGLCGKRLDDGYWFIGGPRCFLHRHGAFFDPPSHEECGRYAIQVCPYLAAPRYAKLIEDRTLRAAEPGVVVLKSNDVTDERPDCFCLGRTHHYDIHRNGPYEQVLVGARPWTVLEWWRHGERIEPQEVDLS